MKKNNSKDNTPLISLSKNGLWNYNPQSAVTMQFPEKDAWRDRLIFTLFEWFKNPRHLVMESFLYEYGIPRRTFDNWRQKYQDIRDAAEDVKIFLGARRREGVMRGELQYGAAYRDMHMLDSQWGPNVDEYHARLKSTEGKNETGNEVYIVEKCKHPTIEVPGTNECRE